MFTKKQYEYFIETMQLCHFTDKQWNNLKAILIDHRDGFTDDQWKTVFHLLSENRLNNEQNGIFVDMLDTSTQKLALLHAGGGTGKTFVRCKIFEELARGNEICHCTCPTGVGALHLPQGWTFHSVFRTWTPSLSAGTAIDEIFKSLGGNQLKMVVVDEVSMLSAQFLILLDTKLQSMYNSDWTFGGISILLIGDFIQLTVTTGCDLWSVMYCTVSGNDGPACNLFQQFCVKELMVNIQSSECKIHTQRVAGFRTLPQVYPSGQKWTAEDNKLYKPIIKDIVDGVTHELTLQNIEHAPNWITKSTCIGTSNVDRAIINAEAAKAFVKRNKVTILRWKCKLSLDFPLSVEAILYDEDERPELFAYFVQGGSGQVLDNALVMCTLVLQMVLHVQCIH
jgi:hypothetical protein